MAKQREFVSKGVLHRWGWALALAGLALLLVGIPVLAAPSNQSVDEGKTIFEQKCASCHTIGGGDRVGPDLKGVTEERDPDWLARWIEAPDKMLAEGDPIAKQIFAQYNNVPMPNLGLSPAEVAAVIAYLKSTSGEAAPAAPAAQPQLQGDPERGRALFVGEVPLVNGGPACRSCHNVSALGVPGGGTLGPALDDVVPRFNGPEALQAWLQSPPTEVMRAVWQDHPIDAQDRADLAAFLASVSTSPPLARWKLDLTLFAVALVVFVVLMVIAQLAWRRRLRTVRGLITGKA